jgi:Glycoside hydrolase family 44
MRSILLGAAATLALSVPVSAKTTTISIDATAGVHAIDPRIYGVNFATSAELKALNAPLNRMGGNNMTDYNWSTNAQNLDQDYYYESYPDKSSTVGAYADTFIQNSKNNGAEPMITIPLIGWVAKLGPGRSILPSFSVAKYGAQCDVDQYDHDAGDGYKPDCNTYITGNDPSDAYIADSPALEQKWLKHIVSKWSASAVGGVKYYLMDNEPSIWFDTHRDIHPIGPHATEYRDKVIAESADVKKADPNALVMAPEEWGWEGYFYSGYDQQYVTKHGFNKFPDRQGEQNGLAYIPWLLKEWKKSGHPVDILSVHFYPQGNSDGSVQEYGNDDSQAAQLLRNRSTRQLWDKNYVSESWIDAPVNLIPLLKSWVSKYYYSGTPAAITEYNWGDESKINGATTQADIYGIFGRENLDMATRWTVPRDKSVTFKAMQMYRNYDGNESAFGDTSVQASAPNPDNVSAFAALRSNSGDMTVMVINKQLSSDAAIKLKLAHFTASGSAQAWRLTASNKITKLPNVSWSGGSLADTEPAQSITLYVLPK